MAQTNPLNILCLSSLFAGAEFMRECRRLGHRVFLLTKEKALKENWPRESLEDLLALPNDADNNLYIEAGSHIASKYKLDHVVALHEFDVLTAALIREHMTIPGMTASQTRFFRDKYTMRVVAQKAGVRVPDFVQVLNHDDINAFLHRVPPPWMLKPRSSAGGIGIRKLSGEDQVWNTIKELEHRPLLHERPSHHLMEQYVKGDVYHVDSLISGGQIVFCSASRYSRPPFDIYHHGGIFISCIIEHGSDEENLLFEYNKQILDSMGLTDGVAHVEFIKGAADGEFYFLEIASRVGGAFIAETCEAANGISLWTEWAKLETATSQNPYKPPFAANKYAGIIMSLARQEWPDTSEYTDPEIVHRVKKRYHAGFIVASPSYQRVQDLLSQYEERISEDFTAVAPPLERPEEL